MTIDIGYYLENYSNSCDIPRGETVRFNHERCPAGTDSRQRLYITRPNENPNTLLAYCHNCSESGYHRDTGATYREQDDTVQGDVLSDTEYRLPNDVVYPLRYWSVEAQVWASKRGGIPNPGSRFFGYSANRNAIVSMMDSAVGEEIGYQMRTLGDGPKYTTCLKDKTTPAHCYIGGTTDLAIVTEDTMSAFQCWNKYLHTGLSMCGTRVDPTVLQNVVDFNKVLVWLDNDSTHVVEQANNIARVLRLLGAKNVQVEQRYSDPKYNVGIIGEVAESHFG